MKKKYGLVVLLLVLSIMVSFKVVEAATITDYTKEADLLFELGLFNGTTTGYELERAPKRIEAAAMMVRLLGAESEAQTKNYKHPFTDVPNWANSIVGYMYEKGLTEGIGNNKFGSDNLTSIRDYTTFMLRVLGYDGDDFKWEKSIAFAVDKSLITLQEANNFENRTFKRNEMVYISYKALQSNLNELEGTLANALANSGALAPEKAFNQGLVDRYQITIKDMDSSFIEFNKQVPILKINANKSEIRTERIVKITMNGSEIIEKMADGYSGSINFIQKGYKQWDKLNIVYKISFYNKGNYIKQFQYLYLALDAFSVSNLSAPFITPVDLFDEIRVSAYPIGSQEIRNDLADRVGRASSTDYDMLLKAILEHKNFSGSGSDIPRGFNLNNEDDFNAYAWHSINSYTSTYADGHVFKPYPGKSIFDLSNSVPIDLVIGDGTYLDARSTDNIVTKATINLSKPRDLESAFTVFIYDEGYNVLKAFIIHYQ